LIIFDPSGVMIDVGLSNLSGFDPFGVMIDVELLNLRGFDPAGVMFTRLASSF
jgi:hypothetical protein